MGNTETTGIQTYTRMRIQSASHERLICMLHEKCCINLKQALETDPSVTRPLLDKAQDILAVLQRSLKPGDFVSEALYHIYDYCLRLCKQGTRPEIKRAETIMNILKKTFGQLGKEV